MNYLFQRLLPSALIGACMIQFGSAATLITSGRNFLEIDFTLTPSFTPSNPPSISQWALQYGPDRVNLGDILRFRLFENSKADDPILDVTYDGTKALNGFLGNFGQSEHFQDLQGLLVIELFQGSVTVDRLFAETYLNGQRYLFSQKIGATLVPEAGVTMMLSFGVYFLLLRRIC